MKNDDYISFLQLKNISKSYSDNLVINNLNFSIKLNSFTTILGPSGCGKSTILKIIGGLEKPNSGSIIFEGKDITSLPPNKREMNTVFQNYALFPHFNVFDNIAFPLKIQRSKGKSLYLFRKKKYSKKEIFKKVKEMINIVGLEGKENSKISELSGGQQQRVAIARSLISKPKILLLDEPLGSLDLSLRKEMQLALKHLHKNFQITFIYVTHDQEEALTLSDHIIILKKGRILQSGKPIDIYNEPQNKWIAKFIGSSNIITNAIYKEKGFFEWDNNIFQCIDYHFKYNEKIDIVIRPEDIRILENKKSVIKGIVKSKIFKGIHWEIIVKTNNYDFLVHTTKEIDINRVVNLKWEKNDVHVMKKSCNNE